MVRPVSNFTTCNSKTKSRNYATNSNDSSKIAFKGQQFPAGYYEDDEIADAKAHLKKYGDRWEKELYGGISEGCDTGPDTLFARACSRYEKEWFIKKGINPNPNSRILKSLLTGGLSVINDHKALSYGLAQAAIYRDRIARLIPNLLK